MSHSESFHFLIIPCVFCTLVCGRESERRTLLEHSRPHILLAPALSSSPTSSPPPTSFSASDLFLAPDILLGFQPPPRPENKRGTMCKGKKDGRETFRSHFVFKAKVNRRNDRKEDKEHGRKRGEALPSQDMHSRVLVLFCHWTFHRDVAFRDWIYELDIRVRTRWNVFHSNLSHSRMRRGFSSNRVVWNHFPTRKVLVQAIAKWN